MVGLMPRKTESGDDGLDSEGDFDDLSSLEGPDGLDDQDLFDDLLRDDEESDRPGRSPLDGSGLTDPERELADRLERVRERERIATRYQRLARDGPMGNGGGGGSSADRDALAIIEAAGRFGLDEDDQVAAEERSTIARALTAYTTRPPKNLSEYNFYAIIAKQATQGTNVLLTLKVPWEHRDEVFRALDTMPFAAMVKITEVQSGGN